MPAICAALFALWMFAETAFEHSAFSRVTLALFVLLSLVWGLLAKRIHLSYWMPFFAAFVLWGLVGAKAFALSEPIAMDTVKTCVVNAVFLFAAWQFLLLTRNMERVFTLYTAAVGALVLYIALAGRSFDILLDRFGTEVGVNPNLAGILMCVAFALSLHRALHKSPWWWFAAVFFFASILLTKSTKAYVLSFLLFVVIMLLRFPKYWWLKLLLFLVFSWVMFAYVLADTPIFNYFDMFFLQRTRYVYENLFLGWDHDNSLTIRQSLSSVGIRAFLQRPFTGWGLDCFRLLPGTEGLYSHNNYIELAVCGGLPALLLYYIPQGIAVVRGAKRARGNPAVQLTLLFTCCMLLMDIGIVSYADRSLLLLPLLLMAAARIAATNADTDGTRAWKLIANPYKLVQWCSTRGYLRHMDDALYLRLLYRGCMGKRLHLAAPVTFNEKQQWMKLYDRDPRYPVLADKLSVRDYIKEHADSRYLIPLLGVWESAEAIDFSSLPDRFVLKCTHDSGSAYVCADKAALDEADARKWLAAHQAKNYYTAGREWPYKNLTPRIIAEAFIGAPDGTPPDDYKFYCFDGKLRAILHCTNRTRHSVDYTYFDPDYRLYPINHETVAAAAAGKTYARPAHLDEMTALAKTLSAGYRFIRVDLYESGDHVYFGEMTLFDNSGFATDLTDGGDRLLGTFLHIGEVEA